MHSRSVIFSVDAAHIAAFPLSLPFFSSQLIVTNLDMLTEHKHALIIKERRERGEEKKKGPFPCVRGLPSSLQSPESLARSPLSYSLALFSHMRRERRTENKYRRSQEATSWCERGHPDAAHDEFAYSIIFWQGASERKRLVQTSWLPLFVFSAYRTPRVIKRITERALWRKYFLESKLTLGEHGLLWAEVSKKVFFVSSRLRAIAEYSSAPVSLRCGRFLA